MANTIQTTYTDNLLETIEIYEKMGLKNPFILIDTNHDNSGKKFMEQIRIVRQTRSIVIGMIKPPKRSWLYD